jgi:CRISPR/Cas system-associated endoribonuclease Cas2
LESLLTEIQRLSHAGNWSGNYLGNNGELKQRLNAVGETLSADVTTLNAARLDTNPLQAYESESAARDDEQRVQFDTSLRDVGGTLTTVGHHRESTRYDALVVGINRLQESVYDGQMTLNDVEVVVQGLTWQLREIEAQSITDRTRLNDVQAVKVFS